MSSISAIFGRRRGAFVAFFLTAAWIGGPSPAHAQNVNYGETFHRFDRNVEYVSTWFRDVKATTVRRPGNLVETIVEDANGVTLARSVASSTTLTLSATLTGDVNGTEVRALLEPNSQIRN